MSPVIGVAVHSEEHLSNGYSTVMDMINVKLAAAEVPPGSQGPPPWDSRLSQLYRAVLYKVGEIEQRSLAHPAKVRLVEADRQKMQFSPSEWQTLVAVAARVYDDMQNTRRQMDVVMGGARADGPCPPFGVTKAISLQRSKVIQMQRDLDSRTQQEIAVLETALDADTVVRLRGYVSHSSLSIEPGFPSVVFVSGMNCYPNPLSDGGFNNRPQPAGNCHGTSGGCATSVDIVP